MNTSKKLTPLAGEIKAFELYRLKRCIACGRLLHSEDSQKRGFGARCALTLAERYVQIHGRERTLSKSKAQKWTKEEVATKVITLLERRSR